MRSKTEYLFFETPKRKELVNITTRVAEIVAASQVQEGFCLVSAMHITAGIWVNDEEPGLKEDFMEFLERLAPAAHAPNTLLEGAQHGGATAPAADYRHHKTGEDNGDAHLKRTVVGHQVILPVTKGRLDLGPWEQVFYAEFDGRRRKRVVVKIIGE